MDRVRHRVVEAGRIRCHILEVVPGVPGTALQLEGALLRMDPATLAVDADLRDVLGYRRHAERRSHAPLPFAAEQVRRALDRRGDEVEVQNPYQAAAEHARRKDVPLVPLAPESARPGFLLRRRIAAAFEDVVAEAQAKAGREPLPPDALASLWPRAARAEPAYEPLLRAEEAEVWRRFRDLVAREQTTRVVAIVRPPRAESLASRLEAEVLPPDLRDQPLAIEVATLEPEEVGKGLR